MTSAHPALLLLADPDGNLKPEFVDLDGDLLLQPGSLIPAWYPWTVDGEERSAKERNAQFKFDLELHRASHQPPMSSSALGALAESTWTAHDVLQALRELRSVWRQE